MRTHAPPKKYVKQGFCPAKITKEKKENEESVFCPTCNIPNGDRFIRLPICPGRPPDRSVWCLGTPPSPMTAGNGATYFLIENTGSEDDRLVNATSNVSEVVELHDMTMDDGVMKMFHVEEGYVIPAGGSVELKPGGKHVMFIGLHEKLEVGQVVTVELEFEKSGKMTIEAEIREE